MKRIVLLTIALVCCFICCSSDKEQTEEILNDGTTEGTAAVTDVTVSGTENEYSFNVTIKSDDTGCSQYADWWEVIDLEGTLIYRRILAHSHVNEQPFTRSGSPIAITADQPVYVRAHMNNSGYGEKAMLGNITDGFAETDLENGFAENLENSPPLPNGCAF